METVLSLLGLALLVGGSAAIGFVLWLVDGATAPQAEHLVAAPFESSDPALSESHDMPMAA